MLTSLVGVVILLGGLIFFHESGHYTVAKLFGVKVEVFSLGFGKKLFSRKIGETEYALSLFPLGGYVKLMGDDPYKGVPAEDAERAFSTQKLYKRFAIVAAGPITNLVLAYVLFNIVFFFGQPMASTRIGTVAVGSPAWEAGIRPRDKITEIGGTKVQAWGDLEDVLKGRVGEKVDVKIERAGGETHIPYVVSTIHSKNVYGEDEDVGGIKGISPNAVESVIGVSDPKSAAGAAGLKSGDIITKLGTRSVVLYEEIDDSLREGWAPGKSVPVTVRRRANNDPKDVGVEQSFTMTLPNVAAASVSGANGFSAAAGIYPSELFVFKVTPGSPAEKSGMQPGDRIVKIGGNSVYNFETIVDEVQDAGGKDATIKVTLDRSGAPVVLDVKPMVTTQEDPLTRQPVKRYLIGFAPQTAYHEAELTKLQIREPMKLLKHSATETFTLADRMVRSIAKLVVGRISVKNLGGPVLIASVAGKSLDAGIIPFIQMMALISINLFLLNLFPIPILDGGHLLFFIIEGIKGKPVSIRTMEIANQIGMVFILMLVGLTLFNDISRIVLH